MSSSSRMMKMKEKPWVLLPVLFVSFWFATLVGLVRRG